MNIDDKLRRLTNSICECGGGGPDDGCAACQLYHIAKQFEKEKNDYYIVIEKMVDALKSLEMVIKVMRND